MDNVGAETDTKVYEIDINPWDIQLLDKDGNEIYRHSVTEFVIVVGVHAKPTVRFRHLEHRQEELPATVLIKAQTNDNKIDIVAKII